MVTKRLSKFDEFEGRLRSLYPSKISLEDEVVASSESSQDEFSNSQIRKRLLKIKDLL